MRFLDRYRAYARQETDAPYIFHDVMAYGVLGTALGNRWRYRYFGGRWLTPHLWILLLAESSTYHKSEALRVARRVLMPIADHFLNWDGSHRGLVEQFSKHDEGVMFALEFEQFLGVLQQNYLSGGRGLFTDLYDGELAGSAYLNAGLKSFKENLAVSFLSGCTPAQLADWLKERDVAAGLLPRFCLVHAREQEHQYPLPLDISTLDVELQGLQQAIRAYAGTKGEIMTISPGAQDVYKSWFTRLGQLNLDSTRADPWKTRLATVCIKLAMINQVDRDLKGKIGEAAMYEACKLTDMLLMHVGRVCQEELALSWYEEQVKRLKYVLRKYAGTNGWVEWSLLLPHMKMKADQLRPILQTLMESDEIQWQQKRPQRLRLTPKDSVEDDA